MKNKSIKIASNLSLPFSIVTNKIALMGGNGSGKTYATMKIIEEVLGANGWVIILDPVGIHYGLRLDKSGKKPSGLDIPIFGGLHGDVILTPNSGKLIADLLCDRRLSAILDVSQFESDAELNRFATEFGDQFWKRMKANKRAVTLVLEECQEFIPQNISKGEERKLHIFNRITKIGRNYGIGVMMISARPQDINKKSLNLTQVMFAFQMTGTHERKAMEEWFTYSGYKSELGGLLPTLNVGEPYVMSPRTLKINQQIKVLPKNTFDSSATPDFDESDTETVSLKPLDISKLEEAMSKQIAEAKANDPAELKKEIARLTRELNTRPVHVKPELQVKEVEVPILKNDEIEELQTLSNVMKEIVSNLTQTMGVSTQAISDTVNNMNKISSEISSSILKSRWGNSSKVIGVDYAINKDKTVHVTVESDGKLPKGNMDILRACGQHPEGCTREQLSVLTGHKKDTRNKYIRQVLDADLVVENGDKICITPDGIQALGNNYQPLPTGDDLRSHWMRELPEGEKKIFSVVCEVYPNSVSREEVTNLTGYLKDTRNKYIRQLEKRFLVVSDSKSQIRANENLWS